MCSVSEASKRARRVWGEVGVYETGSKVMLRKTKHPQGGFTTKEFPENGRQKLEASAASVRCERRMQLACKYTIPPPFLPPPPLFPSLSINRTDSHPLSLSTPTAGGLGSRRLERPAGPDSPAVTSPCPPRPPFTVDTETAFRLKHSSTPDLRV